VIDSSFENRVISAPGARSGAGLQSSVGTPLADRERETIVAALDDVHGNTRRRAEVIEVSVETLSSRLSAYNHCSDAVSLSVV